MVFFDYSKAFDPQTSTAKLKKTSMYIHIFSDGSHTTSVKEAQYVCHSMLMMLYRPIYSATDYHLLQMDIDNLSVWSDDNRLTITV